MDRGFRSAKVLITGGMGFIGSNLAHRLVSMGAEITLVDSMIPEYGGNLWNIQEIRNHVQVNISDVRDEHSMKYLLQGCDYLFNLAGQTSHVDSMEHPQPDLEINARAQLSILKIQSQLGWQPKTSFCAGVEQTLAFYGRYSMHYWQDSHAA